MAGSDGTLTLEWAAKATIFPPLGRAIACTPGPGVCELVLSWGFLGAPDRVARTPLAFAEPAPPTVPMPASTAPPVPVPVASPSFAG